MIFSSHPKSLQISTDGAWLDIDFGYELGEGTLLFNDWDNLSVQTYDSDQNRWMSLDVEEYEPLKDIYEINFSDTVVQLSRFSP